jgi:hypothetical protein
MSLIVNTVRALWSSQELHDLVTAVQTAAPEDETEWIEWKSGFDLSAKNTRATLGRHIIGMANRRVEEAARFAEGFGYILVGVEPGSRCGVTPVDPAELLAGIRPYLGPDGPRWTARYDRIDGPPVLVIIVDPPRHGDPIYALHREFDKYRAGDIFVRKLGRTERADPGDHNYLAHRTVARPAENRTASIGPRPAPAVAVRSASHSRREGTLPPLRRHKIRPRAWLTAVVLVLAATTGLVTEFVNLPSNPRASATSARAVRLPPFRTQLPGIHTTLLLRPDDPLRLLGYLDSKGNARYQLNPLNGDYDKTEQGDVLSPDGWQEAIIGKDRISFINLRTGHRISTPGFPEYVLTYNTDSTLMAENPQFSPNGRYLLAMSGQHIVVIDTQDPKLSFHAFRYSTTFSTDVAWWTSDSAYIIVQISPDSAALYNLRGQLVRRLPMGPNTVPIDSAFGRFLYTCPPTSPDAPSRFGCVMDVATGKVVARVPYLRSRQQYIGILGFYDKNHVYGWAGNQIVVRDFSGRIVGVLAIAHPRDNTERPWLFFSHAPVVTTPPRVAALPPYGTELPGADTTLLLKPTDPLRLFSYSSFTGDGSYLLNPRNGRYKRTGKYDMFSSNGDDVVVSPDGWHEAVIGENTITFVDLYNGYSQTTPVLKYSVSVTYSDASTMPQFSPNGRYLVAMSIAGRDSHALVISTNTLQHWMFTLPENSDNGSFWWMPDSEQVVVPIGKNNTAIAVYDLHGHLLKRLSLGSGAYPIDSAFDLFLYYCSPTVNSPPHTMSCVMDIRTGKVIARVPHLWSLSGSQPLGLFDSNQVYGWAGNRIVIRDFQGRLDRVIAIYYRHDRDLRPDLYFSHSSETP